MKPLAVLLFSVISILLGVTEFRAVEHVRDIPWTAWWSCGIGLLLLIPTWEVICDRAGRREKSALSG